MNPSTPQDAPSAVGATLAVPVWDWPVRVVHWAIAVLVVVLVATGLTDMIEWHMRAGQVLLMLVLFRVLWGFFGSRNARFGAFVTGPSRVLRYGRSLFGGKHEVHATHNLAGGWMVVLLLAALATQAVLGLFANDEAGSNGPLERYISDDLSNTLSGWHVKLWWLIVALAVIHVAAVVYHRVRFRDGLTRAMFTGRKDLPAGAADPQHAATPWLRVVVIAAVCFAAMWLVNR
ncbi:MAG: cytochrome b/b6 domain-containing protein [Proteobacteria bacterium]|nr:cytochrome b/b6 domain-containing protein [Pseudomonadota bacterium]